MTEPPGWALVRSGTGGVLSALEDDHVTEVGLDRLDRTGEDAPEESDGPVRVGDFVRDVGPLEVATVVDGVEADTASPGEGVRDLGFTHMGVDDERSFVGSGLVGGILASDTTGDRVGHDAGKRGTSKRETRSEVVNQVVETTEGLLDAEGGDEFADLAVVVANVVAEPGLREELVGRFRGTHQTEDRTTVLTTVSVGATTLADHVVVDLVKDRVGDVRSRNGERSGSTRTEVERPGDRVTFKPALDSGSRSNGTNVAIAHLGEFVTVAVFPRIANRFGHGVHNGTKLFLTVDGKAEVFQRDPRRLDNSTVNRVVLQLLAEPDEGALFTATSATTTLDVVGGILEGLVEVRNTERVRARVERPESGPSDPSGVTSRVGGRDSPIIDQRGKLVAHPVREGRLLHQIEPRGSVDRPVVDVLVDPVCLFGKNRVDGSQAS